MSLLLPALLLVLPQGNPVLLADLDAAEGPPQTPQVSSGGLYLGQAFGQALFAADQFGGNPGLWLGATAPAPPVRISSLEVGQVLSAVELPNGRLVFTGDQLQFGGDGPHLFVSDGTPNGSVPVDPLGPDGILPTKIVSDLVLWRDLAWCVFNPQNGNSELWSTDGTPSGTQLQWTLGTDFGDLNGRIAVAGDFLLLNTPPGSESLIVFTTPGAPPAGNLGLQPFSTLAAPGDHALEFQGDLILSARKPNSGYELWRTDGTPPGTVLLADINPGAGASNPLLLAADDNFIWFRANQPGVGAELWRSDGTPAGTQLVADLNPGPGGSVIEWGAVLDDGSLVFDRSEGGAARVWVSDGTLAGTTPLVAPLAASTVEAVAAEGGVAVFFTSGAAAGLWGTDGTPGGVQMISDVTPLLGASQRLITAEAGRLWFTSSEASPTGSELWSSDGTAAGTEVFANLGVELVSGDSTPRILQRLGDRFLFTAETGGTGRELYVSDGTAAGTGLLIDLWPGEPGSEPELMGSFGDRMLFSAQTASGREPWITDGTVAGTLQLGDLQRGAEGSFPGQSIQMDGYALFPATPGEPAASAGFSTSLYRTDGTPQGTFEIPGGFGEVTTNFGTRAERLGDRMVFGARAPFVPAGDSLLTFGDSQVWVTDGTPAGTLLLETFPPPPSLSDPSGFERLGDRVYFNARTVAEGITPFVTDGTPAGTEIFLDLAPGPDDSSFGSLVRVDDLLFFLSKGASGGFAFDLWRSDGTAEGTFPLTDVNALQGQFTSLADLTPVDGRLVCRFSSTIDDERVERIYTSDGTVAGTTFSAPPVNFTDFRVTPTFFGGLVGLGASEGLLIGASSDETGLELWTLSDPEAAPELFVDLLPGFQSSRANDLFEFRGRLFYSAQAPGVGWELFSSSLAELGLGGVERIGLGCSSSSGQPEIGWAGATNLGAQLEIQLTEAAPASVALAYYSNPLVLAQFGAGCTVYVGAPKLLTTTVTDGTGKASFAASLPTDPALLGLDVVLQWVSVEPGGPFTGLFGLSDGLEVVFGP